MAHHRNHYCFSLWRPLWGNLSADSVAVKHACNSHNGSNYILPDGLRHGVCDEKPLLSLAQRKSTFGSLYAFSHVLKYL